MAKKLCISLLETLFQIMFLSACKKNGIGSEFSTYFLYILKSLYQLVVLDYCPLKEDMEPVSWRLCSSP